MEIQQMGIFSKLKKMHDPLGLTGKKKKKAAVVEAPVKNAIKPARLSGGRVNKMVDNPTLNGPAARRAAGTVTKPFSKRKITAPINPAVKLTALSRFKKGKGV